MNPRTLYKTALAVACVDIGLCLYGYSLYPSPVLVVFAGMAAATGIVAGKFLWDSRKRGVRL